MNAIMRQAFIEYLLSDDKKFGRNYLVEKLGISPALATKDIKKYRDDFPNNILYDPGKREYHKSINFEAHIIFHADVARFIDLSQLIKDERYAISI